MIRVSFRTKIILSLLVAGITPVAITSYLDMSRMAKLSEQAAYDEVTSVLDLKENRIEEYFETIEKQVKILADQESTRNALEAFTSGIETLGSTGHQVDKAALTERYSYQVEHTVGASPADADRWMPHDTAGQLMQSLYIAENPNQIGSKENMDAASDGSAYSVAHREFHPPLREFLRSSGYYDIFLVDAKSGRIVYTVFKEVDYATNIVKGPYKDTALGRVVRKALASDDPKAVYMSDFEEYAPSYNAWAAFVASPIFEGGKVVGALAFQLPVEKNQPHCCQNSGRL